MALHFSADELAARRNRACRKMAEQGLDGLLMFRQESMYYLTGYDTAGYTMFQGMYLGADGSVALCTRSADRLQAEVTSVIKDVRIWRDREGANPADDIRDMLESYGCRGTTLGVEYHAYGLTAQRGKMLDAALAGYCTAKDASQLVGSLRLIKSAAELQYIYRAGQLADEALAVANRLAVPGTSIGDIYGEMMKSVLAGGGDPPASRWPMGSGDEALLVRYHTGQKRIETDEQVTIEFAGAYRHYHTCLMHVVIAGKPRKEHLSMFQACRDALAACSDALRPGRTVGDVFEAHAKSLARSGYGQQKLNACGYTMGAMYPPTWMDDPLIYSGNPLVLATGMVFFLHMILLDGEKKLTMSLGETYEISNDACARVTHAPSELVVN